MATAQQNGEAAAVLAKGEGEEIMEVDMTAAKASDDEDAIIEEADADLIEMDEGEENIEEKYIEEEDMNYDDLVVEDDGESLSNGATAVSTASKEDPVDSTTTTATAPTTAAVGKGGAEKAANPTPPAVTSENGVTTTTTTTTAKETATPVEKNGIAEKKKEQSTATVAAVVAPVKAVTAKPTPPAPIQDLDDRPVSIPSDSDDEEVEKRKPASASVAPKQNGTQRESDDDDDDEEDCVMLDDTPPSKGTSSSGNSRKAAVPQKQKKQEEEAYDDDIQEILDDPIPINSTTTIQPVSKKMRMSAAVPAGTSLLSQNHLSGLPADLSITTGASMTTKDGAQFTYVDPKALLNSANKLGDVSSLLTSGGLTISQVSGATNSGGGGGAIAGNQRATITAVNSSSSSSNSNNGSSRGGVTLQNNNNTNTNSNALTGGMGNILLPALTDDMFVLEAPSFIVPYIYEKPPSENLRQIVDDMKKELDALKVRDGPKSSSAVEESVERMDEDPSSEAAKSKDDGADDEEEGDEDGEEGAKKGSKKSGKKGGRGGKNADDSWGESDESTDDEASDSETRTKVLIKDVDTQKLDNILMAGGGSGSGAGAGAGEKKGAVGGADNYFESPLGQFFMSIGMSMVQEHVQADLLRMQKRKQQREGGKPNVHLQTAINNLMNNLEASRKDNGVFKFPAKRCDFCNFKSESTLSMANHYEKPHLKGNVYRCNFCEFEARPAHDILYHMEAVHNMKSKLEKPLSYHQCPNCPFEDNGKSKLARHSLACTKKFVPENNLLPAQDWDPPAKIPRVKPRHGLVGTATAYQAMAAQQQRIQAASGMLNRMNQGQGQGQSQAAMSQPNHGQNQAMTANAALSLLQANAALLNNNVAAAMNMGGGGGGGGKSRNRNSQGKSNNNSRQSSGGGGGGQNSRTQQTQQQQQQQMANALMLQNNFNQLAAVAAAAAGKNFTSQQLMQMASQAGILPNASSLTIQQSNASTANSKSSKNAQQPSISITPLPRQNSALGGGGQGSAGSPGGSGGNSRGGGGGGMDASGIPTNLPKPGQHPSGNKSSFVICEICDGYIKDLDQLRSHMQLIHKVKIHPKMIYNRPPLNCQKCQYRFFTDQGLERHLLGSHGLVTSSMQEAANCGQDSGRCPICGRVYQWKLLNHVSRDHNMTLKPAHLSYKCTVCTATFGMYKQFENHVYSAHSTVAKKGSGGGGDKGKGSSSSSGGGGGGGGGSSKSSSSGGGNDSLLKPLKINDEITIIPQPPSKMSKTQTIEIE